MNLVQDYISQGYTADEIQSAFAVANNSSINLTQVLQNSRKTLATADKVRNPVNNNLIGTDSLEGKPFQADLTTSSGSTTTPDVQVPSISTQYDTAPYTVSLSDANISSLTGGVSLEEVDMSLVGRNGLNFNLTRSYSSDTAQYYGMDVNYSTSTDYAYYVEFNATVKNEAEAFKKSWTKFRDVEYNSTASSAGSSYKGLNTAESKDYSTSVGYTFTELSNLYNSAYSFTYDNSGNPWTYDSNSKIYWRYAWRVNQFTIQDFDASSTKVVATGSKPEHSPYFSNSIDATNYLQNSVKPNALYAASEWTAYGDYKRVRTLYYYSANPAPTVKSVASATHSVPNNATKKSYGETMYPIGTGWSWNLSSIEVDSRSGKKFLHITNGGTYEINGTSLVGYPWSDLTLAANTSVTVGGEVAATMLSSTKDNNTQYFSQDGHLIQISDAYGNNIQFTYSMVSPYGKVLTKIANNINNTINISYTTTEVRLTQGAKTVVYAKGKSTDTASKEILDSVTDSAGRVTKYGYDYKTAKFSLISDYGQIGNPYALLTQVNHPTGLQTIFSYEDTATKRYIGASAVNEVYRAKSVENQVMYTDNSTESYNKNTITYTGDIGSSYSTDMTFSLTLSNDLSTTKFDFEKDYVDGTTGSVYYNTQTTKSDKANPSTSNVVQNTYDKAHHYPVPTAVTKQNATSAGKSEAVTLSKTYDAYHNVLTEIDPMQVTTTYTYDTNHRLKTITVPVMATQTKVTTLDYNTQGDVIQETMTTTQQPTTVLKQNKYTYDIYGNLLEVHTLDDGGKDIVKLFAYNSATPYLSSFVTTATDNVTNIDNQNMTVTTTYDYDTELGKPTKVTDSKGNSTTYQYDLLGRIQKQTNPDASGITLTFDDLNNTLEQTSETGQKTRLQWNPLGLKVKTEAYQNGAYKLVMKNEYDSFGRLVSVSDGEKHQNNNTYDNFNRITKTTYGDSSVVSYQYDDLKTTKTTTDADQTSTRETYDKLDHTVMKELVKPSATPVVLEKDTYDVYGNLTSITDADTHTTNYQYDALKQLTVTTDPQLQDTKYTYDKRGHVTQVTYADGQIAKKKYDERGQVIQLIDPLTQVTNNYYDANGNLIKQNDRNFKTTNQPITFQYNNRNQLIQKSAGTSVISFEYDLSGHRTKMTDQTGITAYSFDELGHVASITNPDGKSISYTYDGNGNITSMQDPFGKTSTYTFDMLNRMNAVYTNGTTSFADVNYAYNKGGTLLSAKQQNGITTTYDYNESKFVKSVLQKKSDNTALNNFVYTYDNENNQLTKIENGTTNTYTYDASNRIATSSQNNEAYSYDKRGNRSTVQADTLNLPSETTYEYDAWNQLKTATTSDNKAVTYKYNGDGLMMERTVDGVTSRYYYDVNQQIIAEADVVNGTASLKARYIRGTSGQLVAREDASGNKAYYLFNGHADVMELRDISGNVLNSYSYDIWGNPITVKEMVSNPFRYSGEYFDDVTRLQYLRARWYDPNSGRFLSEDTEEGKYDQPLTLNLYTYVSNNPLKYADPTGHREMDAQGEGGGGLLEVLVVEASEISWKHIFNNHTLGALRSQANRIGAEKVVSWGKTIFNPEWSEETIKLAVELAYKEALAAGVASDEYITTIFGEEIGVYINSNGNLSSAYGLRNLFLWMLN